MSLRPEELHRLVLAGLKARETSYSPYSRFRVGAALLTTDDEIITGCNIENASYGGAICAERTAFVKAVSDGKKSFKAIVVSSDVPAPTTTPCGICRQFMREFVPLSMPVYMVSAAFPTDAAFSDSAARALQDETLLKMRTMDALLPDSFGPENLS